MCNVFTQDVAALKSQPLLGFELKAESPQSLQFKLYHKKTLYFVFKADDVQTAERYSATCVASERSYSVTETENFTHQFVPCFFPTDGSTRSKKPRFSNIS